VTEKKQWWITRWALTTGVRSVVTSVITYNDEGSLREYVQLSTYGDLIRIGRDAFATEAEARARVVALIDAKLKSAEKQRIRLGEMRRQLANGGPLPMEKTK